MHSFQRPFRALAAHAAGQRMQHAAHAVHAAHHVRGARHHWTVGDVAPAVQEAYKPLTGFGWNWREDGVLLTLTIDGTPLRVFVPLDVIWHELHHALSAVGCPLQGGVGEPMSVGSIFGSIAHAVSHAVTSVAHAVVPAIKKAASAVVSKAAQYGKAAIQSKTFRYALDAVAVAVPALAPAAAAVEVAHQAIERVNQGIEAAKAIKNGVVTAANTAKVALAINQQKAMATVVQKAQQGNVQARQVVGAMQQLAITRAAAAAPNPHGFLAALVQRLPHLAQTHGNAMVGIANVARTTQAAAAHSLRPYRVTRRAA